MIAPLRDMRAAGGRCLYELAVRYDAAEETAFLKSREARLRGTPASDGRFLERMEVVARGPTSVPPALTRRLGGSCCGLAYRHFDANQRRARRLP